MDLLSLIPLHTWVAFLSALLIGGVMLGWVASMNWKRALGLPPKYRSIAYAYGTGVILLCFAFSQAAALGTTTGYGALVDLVIIVVVCGLWTLLTHLTHANDDATEGATVAAILPAAPVETGEGDGR